MKAILVTGTSSGIGRAIAETLSKADCFVYATVRNRRDSDSLSKIPNVHPIMMDVTKPDQVKGGIAEIRRGRRGLYGIVNNAGIIDYWPLVELEDEEVRHIFEVNLFGIQRIIRAAAPLLIESGGRIVNISSIEGLVSTKFAGPYEMTKHALEAYSDTLRKELRSHGVTVAIIEPGSIRSSFAKTTARLLAKRVKARPVKIMKKEAEEIAKEWRDEVAGVEKRPSPNLVAAAVKDALFSKNPKRRYLVTAVPEEFLWTLEGLMAKLIQVNQGYEHAFSKEELHKVLDGVWAKGASS